jgi:hypothetical protein
MTLISFRSITAAIYLVSSQEQRRQSFSYTILRFASRPPRSGASPIHVEQTREKGVREE